MRKSSPRTRNFPPAGSRAPVSLATFRDQMADYARAEKLRELRAATHLSQEHVAHEVGVSTKTIRSWESGGKIRWENAKRLGAFYGVDAEELVSRDIAPLVDAPVQQPQLDRIEQKVNRLLACLLTPEQRRGFEDLEALAAELAPARESQRQHRRRA